MTFLADSNTYCQIILNAMKWPGSISEDEKIRIWKEFLAPRFKRAFCLERNHINQAMRKYFNSELCAILTPKCSFHLTYCTILTSYSVDFGSQYYVTANKLQAMTSWHTATEPLEDDVMANVYINFMLKYGRFCAPKSDLEGFMKGAKVDAYQEDPDKEEEGDFTAGFECLTMSDQVYRIWMMFMNSEDDWKTKREENPHAHDKSV
jgi:hypothetical protein